MPGIRSILAHNKEKPNLEIDLTTAKLYFN